VRKLISPVHLLALKKGKIIFTTKVRKRAKYFSTQSGVKKENGSREKP
jgi:hypothetical protein